MWASLSLAAVVALVLAPQRGHPPPMVLVPFVALAWVLGHGLIWLVSMLSARGRGPGDATGRSWPPVVVAGLAGTGVASVIGIVQLVGSGFRGRWYPFLDPALWIAMLLVWLAHGVCFAALLLRKAWSRYLAALLVLGWALLLVGQLAIALGTQANPDSIELLMGVGLVVLLVAFAVSLAFSNSVKAFLER